MGQYYFIVNLDKREFLHPHAFGDGLKLLEFGCSGGGVMSALAVLLANSNNRGGGDLRSDNPIIGSWAGDRIIIAGDYAEPGDKAEAEGDRNRFQLCSDGEYRDISAEAMAALMDDSYLRDDMAKMAQDNTWSTACATAYAKAIALRAGKVRHDES